MPSGANAARTNTATGSNNQQGKEPEQLVNCALCTAAALTGETSGVVNANLQQGLANPANRWGEFQSDRAFTEYVTYDPSVQEKGKNIFGTDVLVAITPVDTILQMQQQLERELLAQRGDDPTALAELALPYQIVGLAVYVNGKLGKNVQWSMRPNEFVPRAGSGDNAGPTRAKAAIPFMNSQPDGTKFAAYTAHDAPLWHRPHWIYAEKEGGKVTFKDFQQDMQVPLASDERTKLRFSFPKFPEAPGPVISENPLGPNGMVYTDGANLMFVLAFGDKLVPAGQ
jgi:hypothetical protein